MHTPPRLRRSDDDRVIAGVCGGLGRYLGVDPILLRLGLIALCFVGGSGIALYLAAWIVIPQAVAPAGQHEPTWHPSSPRRDTIRFCLGAAFIAAGVFSLADLILPPFVARLFWPAILLAVGVSFLVRAARGEPGAGGAFAAGLFFSGLGFVQLLSSFGLFHLSSAVVLPVVLIGLGFAIVLGGTGSRQ